MTIFNAFALISFLICSWSQGFSLVSRSSTGKLLSIDIGLVNARAFETDLPSNLNIFLHAFEVCQERWHLARKQIPHYV